MTRLNNLSVHPLAAFRLRAVLDWVELQLHLSAPTQARHLRARMPSHWGLPYAKPSDDERPESCRVFIVRVQDPDPATLWGEVKGIDAGAEAEITGIELALDAFPRTDEASARLPSAAFHLHRHQAFPPPGTPCICRPGSFKAAAGRSTVLEAFQDGLTINTGQGSVRSRCYVKRYDTTSGERYRPLPPSVHRARLEITLVREACPVRSIQDIQVFKFETLAMHFTQVQPALLRNAAAVKMQEQQTRLGRAIVPNRTKQPRRKSRTTTRDIELNARIRDALRMLTNRTVTATRKTQIRESLSEQATPPT